MTDLILILKRLAALVPFVALALLAMKANLKKEYRSRQFAMPVLALVYCIVAVLLIDKVYNWALSLLESILSFLSSLIPFIRGIVAGWHLSHWAFFMANTLFMAAYLVFKRAVISILKGIFKTGNGFYETVVHPFYEYDADDDTWFVRNEISELRRFFKAMYIGTLILVSLMMLVITYLYAKSETTSIFYPGFGVILVGELYFFLDGLTKKEYHHLVSVEEDESFKRLNYSLMREVLRKLFPDKLNTESTEACETSPDEPMERILEKISENEDPVISVYGRYMTSLYENRFGIDRNYLYSGIDLLKGRSVLFNNPFYRDFIPYIFYPMNRSLLRSKKVLIILGRNGIEDDVKAWVQEGLVAVNSTPDLWSIGVLGDNPEKMPDVGIITRSDVHDLKLHEACNDFFKECEFAVILEPSKLLSTAQIGLNSIAKRLRKTYGVDVTWCAIDKNCDGLVDALSHALVADIHEVSATEKHTGVSSYMFWDADRDAMQHRLLPNISRYLGFGTELSFAALKKQIEKTYWFGGENFPVTDMHWIAKQYYHDLLSYAELPTTQKAMDERFVASPNLWSAGAMKHAYMTVEDEDHNMFEIRRAFSTRASEQGFVNILSDEYLLKDYMAANASIFEADAKAIPHIVADYVRSERNVALRMALMMSSGTVREEDLRKELELIGIDSDRLAESLWELISKSILPVNTGKEPTLTLTGKRGITYQFDQTVIRTKPKYNIDTGKVETLYYIDNPDFIRLFVTELQNADCITEDEKDEVHFLGSELRGHIFQKYLPGQLFTLDGKYYEMLNVTPRGEMLVRRAADHISGRVSYRQVRNYHIHDLKVSEAMGSVRDFGGLKVTRAFADISVDTPAYWEMDRYSDFASSRKVTLNGIPTRTYNNKQLLKIELPTDGLTGEVRYTVTTLFNEVFRTLLAESQPYLVAVTPGSEALSQEAPLTYSIDSDHVDLGENTIYLIEDSQLDIGLLVAVERNLKRIFEIICDYLDWNQRAFEESKNPPPEKPVPDFRVQPLPEDGNIPKVKKKKNIFNKIGDFFRKLFKIKPKQKPQPQPQQPIMQPQPIAQPVPQAVEQPVGPMEQQPLEPVAEMPIGQPTDQPVEAVAEQPVETPVAPEVSEDIPEAEEAIPQQDEASEGEPESTDGEDDVVRMSFSMSGPVARFDDTAETSPETEEPADVESSEADAAEAEPDEAEAVGEAETEVDPVPEETVGEGFTVSFENAQASLVQPLPVRLPYHKRCFLLFGYSETPDAVKPDDTLDYLRALGYGNNLLKQARDNKDLAERIESGMVEDGKHHLCDFCGRELTGMEYEVLADGRERCTFCSRTAVRTAEEFGNILTSVLKNLQNFFGVQITVPVRVEMVNAKKLHRKLGKSFVPTGSQDGRVLGVAIKSKEGYTILIENGAPHIQSTMTLAHELTHIWQYLNWDQNAILYQYGPQQELEIYEGMAKWVEIQYAYLIGETSSAKREEINTRLRMDEYGNGFRKYAEVYPITRDVSLAGHATPFTDPKKPL